MRRRGFLAGLSAALAWAFWRTESSSAVPVPTPAGVVMIPSKPDAVGFSIARVEEADLAKHLYALYPTFQRVEGDMAYVRMSTDGFGGDPVAAAAFYRTFGSPTNSEELWLDLYHVKEAATTLYGSRKLGTWSSRYKVKEAVITAYSAVIGREAHGKLEMILRLESFIPANEVPAEVRDQIFIFPEEKA